MEIKQVTLGNYQVDEPQEETTQEVNQEQAVVAENVVTEPVVETVTEPVVEVTQEQAVAEENSSDFNFNIGGEEAAQGQPVVAQPTTISWQDAIKQADPLEVAKALGISEFALEMDRHIKNNGAPIDYLNAKAIDYTKVDDVSMLKAGLRQDFPNATDAQLDLFITKKYKQGEIDEDDDKEFGAMQMQADANKIRQQKIAEQANFKIPEPVKQAAPADDIQAQQRAIAELEQRRNFVLQHEATKDLLTSKRVAVDLGEGVSYKWNLGENAHKLAQPLVDDAAWQKMTTNEKGEPDVKLLQKLAFIAANPNYERDLFNYGKSIGKKSRKEELQNASLPHGSEIVQDQASQGTVVKGQTTLAGYK